MPKDISMVDTIHIVPIEYLKPYEGYARQRTGQGLDVLVQSIRAFGFKVPLLVDNDGVIISGHARYEAAKLLGMPEVPCIIIADLPEEDEMAFRLVDNQTSDMSGWDFQKLEDEQENLPEGALDGFGFDPLITVDVEDFFAGKLAKQPKEKEVPKARMKPKKEQVKPAKAQESCEKLIDKVNKRGRPLKVVTITCPCCGKTLKINSRFEVVGIIEDE